MCEENIDQYDEYGLHIYDAVLYSNRILILSNYGVFDVTISAPTNITETATEHCPATGIHDLQGRALNEQPAKGVYIQDGKKRVVR